MESVKKWLSERTKKNGLYVHYSPPKLLVSSAQLRQWARGGVESRLERAVLAGQGRRLLAEAEALHTAHHLPALVAKCDALHAAVERGSLLELQELLDSDYNRRKYVMCRDEAGAGLLHKAVYYDYMDIAEYLVKNYPQLVHQRDSEGRTALHYAVCCRDEAAAAALLEGAGAARGARDVHGRPPAHYRGQHRTLLVLPTASDMPSETNKNPRGLVIKRHNIRIWCHDCDMARLQRVVWEGHGARLLSEVSNQPVVKKFLEAVPYIMNTIREIHNCVVKNDLEGLMKHAGDPVPPQILSSRDTNNMNVLHKAAGLGYGGILKYITDRYPQGINDVDNDGRTPLHYAAAVKDDRYTYNSLVTLGADESAVDNKNRTPGYYISKPQEIDKNVFKTLPEAPRTASSAYPPSWDWKLLDTEVIADLSKKPRKKNFKSSTENISSKNNSNTVSEHSDHRTGGMKGSSTHEFIKGLPELDDNKLGHNKNNKSNSNLADKKDSDVIEEHDEPKENIQNEKEELNEKEDNEEMQNTAHDETPEIEERNEKNQKEEDGNEKETENAENEDPHHSLEDINKGSENGDKENSDQIEDEVNKHESSEQTFTDEESNQSNKEKNKSDVHKDIDDEHNSNNDLNKTVKHCENNDESNEKKEEKIKEHEDIDDHTHAGDDHDEVQDENDNKSEEEIDHDNHHNDEHSLKESENKERDSASTEGNNNNNQKDGEDDDDVQVQGDSPSEYSDIHLRSTAELPDTANTQRGKLNIGRNTQESLIEGIISGDAELDSQDASMAQREESVQGDMLVVDSEIDPEVTELINSANMEMLAALVLNGEGSRLVGRRSANPELQAFLENVPTYMQKINKVHIAAREGNIRDLQAALDRRKFAIARDPISANGATPLHIATIFGKTNIMKYLGGRFPETLSAVDFEGRTALHYAAILPDNGHYYNLLQQLGANSKDLDDNGRSAEDYHKDPALLSFNQLLSDFGISEDVAQDMLSDKGTSHGTNGHMDIPIFKTEEGRYLAKSLGDPLIKGLTEVANVKPKDPVAFLASFLHNFPDQEKTRLGTQESNLIVTQEDAEVENDQPPPPQQEHRRISRSASRTATRPHRPIDVVAVEPQPEISPDAPEAAFSSANRDEHGQSMLHFAAARTHTRNALFQLIQESDISLAYRDELYRTARDVSIQANVSENTNEIDRWVLHLAARGNTEKIMELLLEGYDHILDVVDEQGVSITEVISQRGDNVMANLLSSIPTFEESRESLHVAIRRGDLEAVQKALSTEGGRTLARAKNSFGRSSLHIAVLAQHEEIVAHLAQNYPELLRMGDNLERTSLHYAMGVEKIESLSRVLIRSGAKRVLKDLKGRQPSYYFMNKSDILRLKEEEEVY